MTFQTRHRNSRITTAVARQLSVAHRFRHPDPDRDGWYADAPDGSPDWGLRFAVTFLFPRN